MRTQGEQENMAKALRQLLDKVAFHMSEDKALLPQPHQQKLP